MPKQKKSKIRLRYKPLPLISISELSGLVPESQQSICNSQVVREDKYTDFLLYEPRIFTLVTMK